MKIFNGFGTEWQPTAMTENIVPQRGVGPCAIICTTAPPSYTRFDSQMYNLIKVSCDSHACTHVRARAQSQYYTWPMLIFRIHYKTRSYKHVLRWPHSPKCQIEWTVDDCSPRDRLRDRPRRVPYRLLHCIWQLIAGPHKLITQTSVNQLKEPWRRVWCASVRPCSISGPGTRTLPGFATTH